MKTAVALRHVHFEGLGSFEPVLESAGYNVSYLDVGVTDLKASAASQADLLIVLGAPIGAYEDAAYPFLQDELHLIDERLSADAPLLGICLGAQLIARALGCKVYPSGIKEIGWAAVELTEAGRSRPLRHLEGVPLLHWHGDTFDLPEACDLLASTPACRNQAFSRGQNLLAVQFHPEATLEGFERWLIGHAVEIVQAGLDPVALRADAKAHAKRVEEQAPKVLLDWLSGLH